MDKISPIKERILQFIDYKGITKTDFSEKTGIAYANLKGKGLYSEIGGSYIAKILSIYEDISPEWLLTGKGEMLKESSQTVINSVSGKKHKIGDINIAGNGSIISEKATATSDSPQVQQLQKDIDSLKKELAYAKQIIEEKERTIQILIATNDKK